MARRKKVDLVNHPPHYTRGKFETIDVIEDIVPSYTPVEAHLVGEVIRYISRANFKENKKQDLEKALWYLKRLVLKQ